MFPRFADAGPAAGWRVACPSLSPDHTADLRPGTQAPVAHRGPRRGVTLYPEAGKVTGVPREELPLHQNPPQLEALAEGTSHPGDGETSRHTGPLQAVITCSPGPGVQILSLPPASWVISGQSLPSLLALL